MASTPLSRAILRLPFRVFGTRPYSTTQSHLQQPNYAAPSSPSTRTAVSEPPPPPSSSSSPPRPITTAQGLINSLTQQQQPRQPQQQQQPPTSQPRSAIAETQSLYRANDLSRHIHRRFRPGDVYAPHDLSPTEQEKWRPRRNTPKDAPLPSSKKSVREDAFDVLAIHPLAEFKNPAMMTEYVTSMGRIRHRRETGLRGVNQRRVARAVRRAVGMGLLPSVHKHPEMLEREAVELARRRGTGRYRFGGMRR
ncbi:MAG: hypothetical protein Q9219_002081 [cf. Caloplaca sp. 3 TL-2023]